MTEEHDVVIIGAGLAGLSSAHYLNKAGIKPYIFEARGRIGGRVHTTHFFNNVFDELGGKEINDGGDAENLKTLAAELEVKIIKINAPHHVRTLNSSQQIVDFFDLFDEIPNNLNNSSLSFSSLSERLDFFFQKSSMKRGLLETWISCYEGLNTVMISDRRGMEVLSWVIRKLKLGKCAENNRVSEFFEMGGSYFVEKIAKPFAGYLSLNKVVQSIMLQDDLILITFEDGQKVLAHNVILSVPYPIIGDIHFDKALWLEEERAVTVSILNMGSNSKILIPVKTSINDPKFAITPQFTAWWNDKRTVLTIYSGGREALIPYEDELSQEAAFNNIWPTLCALYPNLYHQDISFRDCQFVNWTNDDFAKGSYTFVRPGYEIRYESIVKCFGTECREVFKPLKGKLFFAGEHASVTCPSTMEGAIESGKRAAEMIINKLGLEKK